MMEFIWISQTGRDREHKRRMPPLQPLLIAQATALHMCTSLANEMHDHLELLCHLHQLEHADISHTQTVLGNEFSPATVYPRVIASTAVNTVDVQHSVPLLLMLLRALGTNSLPWKPCAHKSQAKSTTLESQLARVYLRISSHSVLT